MREESVYKIIGWILLPITVLIMLYGILALLMMPSVLVIILDIVVAGTLMYLIRSVSFFRRNIVPNIQAKRNVKAGIRLGAFFAIFFVLEIISGCVTLLSKQNILKSQLDIAVNMMQGKAVLPPREQLYQIILVFIWMLLIYALLLLLHLLMSMLFLRRYNYLFEEHNS